MKLSRLPSLTDHCPWAYASLEHVLLACSMHQSKLKCTTALVALRSVSRLLSRLKVPVDSTFVYGPWAHHMKHFCSFKGKFWRMHVLHQNRQCMVSFTIGGSRAGGNHKLDTLVH